MKEWKKYIIYGICAFVITCSVVIGSITILKMRDVDIVLSSSAHGEEVFKELELVATDPGKWSIYYDFNTGVMYVMNARGGVTPLLNSDGSPRLYYYWIP